jgi:hypothetical protein
MHSLCIALASASHAVVLHHALISAVVLNWRSGHGQPGSHTPARFVALGCAFPLHRDELRAGSRTLGQCGPASLCHTLMLSLCQSQIRPAHWSASAFWSRAMCAQGTHHTPCYASKKLFKCARVYHFTFVSLIFMPPLTTHIVLPTPTASLGSAQLRRNEGHR